MIRIMVAFVFLLFPFHLRAATGAGREFGAGIILGAPSAISAKYWLHRDDAIDGGLAFSFSDYLLLYGDYLFHYPGAFGRRTQFLAQLTPYIGLGGVIVITTHERNEDRGFYGRRSGTFGLGLRVPLGLEWRPQRPSIGVYAEIAPGLSLIPSTSGFLQGGIGIRYYF